MVVWLQSEGKERHGDKSVPRLDPALAAATHPCRGGWPCLRHDDNEHFEGDDAGDNDDRGWSLVAALGVRNGTGGVGEPFVAWIQFTILIDCFNMNVLTTKVACFGLLDDPKGG